VPHTCLHVWVFHGVYSGSCPGISNATTAGAVVAAYLDDALPGAVESLFPKPDAFSFVLSTLTRASGLPESCLMTGRGFSLGVPLDHDVTIGKQKPCRFPEIYVWRAGKAKPF